MRGLGLFILVASSTLASAQNFPEVPPNLVQTKRSEELLQIMRAKWLISERVFPLDGPARTVTAVAACETYLSLIAVQLGQIPEFRDRYAFSDWVWHLPLVEAFLAETYASVEQIPEDTKRNIGLIRERARRHGLDINDAAMGRFSDVPVGHWADEAIHNMRMLGIVRGYPDNTFRGSQR